MEARQWPEMGKNAPQRIVGAVAAEEFAGIAAPWWSSFPREREEGTKCNGEEEEQ
ncbi:hypothetical protein DEO72_LG9g1849 [Vigna unguiculata]|uniref:Uncharacterized protein n=1 Tax=Vigna unguiculata TaxID=3917 RepID=A0A4D6N409_VIGUN|nr:hypothetical protein DEO72_LG9g1849 [Vigna unguiculata]